MIFMDSISIVNAEIKIGSENEQSFFTTYFYFSNQKWEVIIIRRK